MVGMCDWLDWSDICVLSLIFVGPDRLVRFASGAAYSALKVSLFPTARAKRVDCAFAV